MSRSAQTAAPAAEENKPADKEKPPADKEKPPAARATAWKWKCTVTCTYKGQYVEEGEIVFSETLPNKHFISLD